MLGPMTPDSCSLTLARAKVGQGTCERPGAKTALLLTALAIASCGGWGKFDEDAKRICAKTLAENLGSETLSPDEKLPIEKQTAFLDLCKKSILDAVEPCRREHKYGTDSALQCIDRYATPALQEAVSALIQVTVALQAPRIAAAAALNKMWSGAIAYYESEHLDDQGRVKPMAFPNGDRAFTRECCATGARCPTDDELAAQEPWGALNFSPTDSKYLQYQFWSEGTGREARFVAVVAINPLCKGKKRYLSRRARVDADTGDVVPDGTITESAVMAAPPPPTSKPAMGGAAVVPGTPSPAQMNAIESCYNRALKRNPALSGKLVIRWTIKAAGTVSGVDIDQDSLGDSAVANCVKGLIARWHFPVPKGESVEVSFPFVFPASR
jgi:hypothetical protein